MYLYIIYPQNTFYKFAQIEIFFFYEFIYILLLFLLPEFTESASNLQSISGASTGIYPGGDEVALEQNFNDNLEQNFSKYEQSL